MSLFSYVRVRAFFLSVPPRVKSVQYVFEVLSLVLHFDIQTCVLSSCLCSRMLMMLVFGFDVQDDKSSAKSPISTLSDFVSEISLKKRLKSVGPKTLPWGTPAFINFL